MEKERERKRKRATEGRRQETCFDRGLSIGTAIMSHVSLIRLFIADLAGKQKINNFEQI